MKIEREWTFCPDCGEPVVFDDYGNKLEVTVYGTFGKGQIVNDVEHECN